MTCSSNTISTSELRLRSRAIGLAGAAAAIACLLASGWTGDRAWAARPLEGAATSALSELRERASRALGTGDVDAARDALNRALVIAPLDPGLWVEIARFRYRGGEHVLAIEAAERALSLGPGNPEALQLKAEIVRDRDGPVPALGWFEKAVARAPDDLALKADYAATLGDAGRALDMLTVTREILEADPRNARAFYLQAVLAARAGNYRLARRLLDRTGGQLGKLPGALLLRGIIEIDGQNYGLAIASLESLVAAQPGNRKARDLLARALFLSGDYRQLTERFGDAVQAGDASSYLAMTVARGWEQLDRRDRAAPLLDRIALGENRRIVAIGGQGPVGRMLANGDVGGARALVGGWLAENPGNFDHLALAGDVELYAGNGAAAIDYYARAARIRSPESLRMRRFQALMLGGQSIRAQALAGEWLADSPASPAARRTGAWLAANAGDWARARGLYEDLAAHGSRRDVQLLSDLALVQIKAGDLASGVGTARRAHSLFRAQALSAQALAVALVAAGERPASAASLLAKTRGMIGDNPLLVETRTVLAATRPAG